MQTAVQRTVPTAALLCACSGLMCARPTHGEKGLRTLATTHQWAFATASAVIQHDKDCRIIYLGFVGALEPAHNKSSGVVQIADLLRGGEFPDVCAKSYSPYVWGDGLRWLLTHFPSHAGVVSAEELQNAPRVVLVGHSMGGWAMMRVARRLRSRGIPVELTIQIDSVGLSDYTLPRNVKCAANFHARDVLMPLTTKRLRMEDPSRTKLLANVTVEGAGHESITRDPRIRELVLQTIKSLRASLAVLPVTPASRPSALLRPAEN